MDFQKFVDQLEKKGLIDRQQKIEYKAKFGQGNDFGLNPQYADNYNSFKAMYDEVFANRENFEGSVLGT